MLVVWNPHSVSQVCLCGTIVLIRLLIASFPYYALILIAIAIYLCRTIYIPFLNYAKYNNAHNMLLAVVRSTRVHKFVRNFGYYLSDP